MRPLPEGFSPWRPEALVSTWFGVGLLPKAPGTWGSLAALPVAWGLATWIGASAVMAAAVVAFLAGLWAVKVFLAHTADRDPGPIVIDEVAGQLLAAAPAAADPLGLGVAFALFRVFDIWKPWPVGLAERRLPGALGVMADDIVAGLYAAAGVLLFLLFIEADNVLF